MDATCSAAVWRLPSSMTDASEDACVVLCGWADVFFCISAAAPKPEPPPTSAQASSSATIFPALPPFFFCSGAGADGCGCAADCSKLYE